MTPTEMAFTFRFVALLCAWALLAGLLGVAGVVEMARRRGPTGHIVSNYTIAVTVVATIAIGYMLAGDTP